MERFGVVGRALVVWALIASVEVVHGVIRALLLVPLVGELRSRQIGVFSGSMLILLIASLTIRFIAPPTRQMAGLVGGVWVTLMVIFEFGLGRMLGRSWAGLLSDYDVSAGGLLLFGMLVLGLSPLIAARLRHLHATKPPTA